MRLLIQRVKHATITIDQKEQHAIDYGAVVYLGISADDLLQPEHHIAKAVERILNIPIFSDEESKLKSTLQDIEGDLLIVSNFTLYGKNKKGNQIDYTDSASFDDARAIYDELLTVLQSQYDSAKIKTGSFGAYMEVNQHNDGPVNIIIDC